MDPEEPGRQEAQAGQAAASEPVPAQAAPRRRGLRIFLIGVPIALLLLIGWNRTANSDRFCASCHVMAPAVITAARSVHADVSCIECHSDSGAWGSVRYLPTLAREGLATITGWGVAHGVLSARSCTSCHGDPADNPALAAAHTGPRTDDCGSCHGEVSHPIVTLPGAPARVEPRKNPHPVAYTQIHGAEAVEAPSSCVDCHQEDFCQACHFRETFPHPPGWIGEHGPAQERQGPNACTLCHEPTFCAGCHGTEIPHEDDWISQHWRDLQDAPVTPCLTCHTTSDCSTCHSRHAVHEEQTLYS